MAQSSTEQANTLEHARQRSLLGVPPPAARPPQLSFFRPGFLYFFFCMKQTHTDKTPKFCTYSIFTTRVSCECGPYWPSLHCSRRRTQYMRSGIWRLKSYNLMDCHFRSFITIGSGLNAIKLLSNMRLNAESHLRIILGLLRE